MRKIIHLDMDAFFASIEQRDNPALKGVPLVVGGNPDKRGVVAAASYEARRFGIRAAMSCHQARKLCPEVVFVRPRIAHYQRVSRDILAIMHSLTPLVEPLSLDEAYLDVTDQPFCRGSALLMADWLRSEIFNQTGLSASAGVSFNKMLAKIASELNKPNGTALITPQMAPDFIDALPIEKIFGIGKATAKTLHTHGIHTGKALKATPLQTLIILFGKKRGEFYHNIVHLKDERSITPNRPRKSLGSETTFEHNQDDSAAIIDAINAQAAQAFAALNQRQLCARSITLKIKYANFSQITRSHSQDTPFEHLDDTLPILARLFDSVPRALPIRLVGVGFSSLQPKSDVQQLTLF